MKVKQKVSELINALLNENAELHREKARLEKEVAELRAREFHRAGQVGGVSLEAIEFIEAGECRRKTRKYDWSKTLGDVLVKNDRDALMKSCEWRHPTKWLSDLWQPNIHGKCPVDPEVSLVRVILANGEQMEKLACDFDWSCDNDMPDGDIKAWQFVRLVDGVEW